MNKRQRKKYLKEKGLYVMNKETWNLDGTIARWIIPRLKLFKKLNIGYPSCDRKIYAETKEIVDMTYEQWNNIIDEIIIAFEQIIIDPMDIAYDRNLNFKNKLDYDIYKELCEERQQKIERGLDLFKYYIQDLWW